MIGAPPGIVRPHHQHAGTLVVTGLVVLALIDIGVPDLDRPLKRIGMANSSPGVVPALLSTNPGGGSGLTSGLTQPAKVSTLASLSREVTA